MAEVKVVRAHQRTRPEGQTPGMIREEALAGGGVWVGLARTEPGMVSGWHHHDGHDTYLYVLSGALRLEYGPAGRVVAEAGSGDFVHIPRHMVHRESNPAGEVAVLTLVRVGGGEVVVNVDGPDAP